MFIASSLPSSLSHSLSLSLSLAYSHRDEWTHTLFRLSASLSASFPSQAALLVSVLQSNEHELFSCLREHSFSRSRAPNVSPSHQDCHLRLEFRGSTWSERSSPTGRLFVGIVLTGEMGERLSGET